MEIPKIIVKCIIIIFMIFLLSGVLLSFVAWRGLIDCPSEQTNQTIYKFQTRENYKGLTCTQAVIKNSKENHFWFNNFVFIVSVVMLLIVLEVQNDEIEKLKKKNGKK